MPGTLIEIGRSLSAAEERALMDAVHSALVEAFRIPEHDRTVRLMVHAPHRFLCPPNRARPECFTLVTIDAFPGRSLNAKRALYRAITRNLQAVGVPPDHVTVLLREHPQENWGIRGGQAASDVDLGFLVEV